MSFSPRKIAVDIIYNILKNGKTLSDELNKLRNEHSDISALDTRFVSEIVNGVLRNLEYCDYLISLASSVKLNKISPYVLNVLRCGCYQLIFMDKVPSSAAVNESVKIIKKSSNARLSGFVNAVLRKIDSNGKDVQLPKDNLKRLSVLYSCPMWLVEKFFNSLNDDTVKLLESFNKKPSTILRVNKLRTTREDLINRLNSKGWNCTEYTSDLFPDADYLISADKIDNLETTDEFKDGLFYIQDPAAAYVGEVLRPEKGSVVLDMCASPGGKSTHFAEIMGDEGRIYSFDVSIGKAKRIEENASRLKLKSISAIVKDSTVFDPEFENTADYILVDAPCTGIGIIRKKPDIKYLRKPDDSKNLSKISLSILNTAADYLKPGGTMVFSTCTIFEEENEMVLFDFLKGRPDFSLKTISCNMKNKGYMTLYPHKNNCDGFFISLLTKEQ